MGYPLLCSGLEKSMDSVVHGLTKNRTQPSLSGVQGTQQFRAEPSGWLCSKTGLSPHRTACFIQFLSPPPQQCSFIEIFHIPCNSAVFNKHNSPITAVGL